VAEREQEAPGGAAWVAYLRAWRAGQPMSMGGAVWARLAGDPEVAAQMLEAIETSPVARVRLIHATAEVDPELVRAPGPRTVWVHAQAWVGLPTYPRLERWTTQDRASILGDLVRRMLVVLGPERTRKHVLSLPSLLDMVGREVDPAERDAIAAALEGSRALDGTVLGALGVVGTVRSNAGQVWAEEVPVAVQAHLDALLAPVSIPVELRDALLWPGELESLPARGQLSVPLLRLLHLTWILSAPGLLGETGGSERHLLPDVVLELVDALPAHFWPELRLDEDADAGWRARWLHRLAEAFAVALLAETAGLRLDSLDRTEGGLRAVGRAGESLAVSLGAPPVGSTHDLGRSFGASLNAAARGAAESSAVRLVGVRGAPAAEAGAGIRHLAAVLRAAELWEAGEAVEAHRAALVPTGVVEVVSPVSDGAVYVGTAWSLDRVARRAGRPLVDGRERVRVVFAVDRQRLGEPHVEPTQAPRVGQRADGRAAYSLAEDGTLLLIELGDARSVH
jgi:hypothetical protein